MKISIITVCWNSEQYLAHAIESVLNQDYQNIEYLIIDGGSTDNTINIIKEYEPRFNGRMKWISEKDKGLYDAMNKGIKMASGDVVGILNSDDFFTSNNIISQVAAAFNTDQQLDALYGDVHFVHPADLNKCTRYYSSSIFKQSLMRLGFMPAHPTFYVKKTYFDQFGYYKMDYKIGADFELLLRFIFVHRIKLQYLPIDFVTMRTGGASTSGIQSHIQIMKDHLKAFKQNNVYTNIFILGCRYIYKLKEFIPK